MKQTSQLKRRKVLFILLALIPILFLLSLNAGYTKIPLSKMFHILVGEGTKAQRTMVFYFRMPRIALSLLVGAGFALSGCILQGITRNPLADPGLLGINAGAGFIVLLFITLSGKLGMGGFFSLPAYALLGGLLAGGLIYMVSYRKNQGISPIHLVLNGVAIQAGIQAMITMMILKMDDTQAEFLALWQGGSIWNTTWKSVIALLPWIIIGFLFLMWNARTMDVLAMGDEISKGLGVRLVRTKAMLLTTAVALAAASVAMSGSMSFVGLIAPHLARTLVGTRHRYLFPVSALMGGILVLVADMIGRTIIVPREIPAGIVVSVLGAPYFIFLLIRSRK